MSVATPPRPPSLPPSRQPDPDALIKEARDRQRRRRRRMIGLVLALLAAGGAVGYGIDRGGGNSSPTGAKPGASPSSPSAPRQREQQLAQAARKTTIGDAALIAPGVGWAINGNALWLTINNGTKWRRITPPDLRGQDVIARAVDVHFIDAKHGWVSAELNGTRIVKGSLRYGGILITSDGGNSWHLVTLPGCYHCANSHFSFLDSRRGFALTATQSSDGTFVGRLYATSDGGTHWTLVRATRFYGRIVFTDRLHGWALTDPSRWAFKPCCAIPIGEGLIYRTSDGGRSWQRVTLPAPVGYQHEGWIASWMRFFDTRDGVIASLALDRVTKRLHVLVDVTNDGGRTWAVRAAPLSSEQPQTQDGLPYASFSAATTHDWMLFSRTRPLLFRTSDAGHHWSTVAMTPHPRPTFVWAPDFVTPDDGWAVFPTGNSGEALVRTTDGGRTWTPLTPPEPKLPPAPTPAPVCGSSCRRP
jgi:photosystem II stability/assembly factor-like uncharacterized protein